VTDHDASSPLAACYPIREVVNVTRIGYYALKTLEILGKAVPPP